MNSLGVMEKYGLPIVLVIFLATVILLAATGLFSQFILSVGKRTVKTHELNQPKTAS